MLSNNDRVMVFAAHPDDEVIGMGGSLARFVELGMDVLVFFVADGVSSREALREGIEARKNASRLALSRLGVGNIEFLDLPDNQLDTVPKLQIIKAFEEKIQDFKPSVVFANYAHDLNVDHRVVAESAIVAARPRATSTVRALIHYEVASSTDMFFGEPMFSPNYFIDISHKLSQKLDALNAYSVEIGPHPSSRSTETIMGRNTYWGGYSGFVAAEAFKIAYSLYD